MEQWDVQFSPRAIKDLHSLPKNIQKNISDDLESISHVTSPISSTNVKKTKTQNNYYRYRSGDYRVIFKIINHNIQVLRIINRKDLEKILSQLL